MTGKGGTVALRRRPLYAARIPIWGITSAGMILIVSRRLLLGSPLGQSPVGTWGIWIILALAVAGVATVTYRKLRLAGPFLSGHGLTVEGRVGQQTLPWSGLVSVTATNSTNTRVVARTLELRFRGEPLIYIADEFTVGRDELIRLIREYASAAGTVPAFPSDRSAGEEARDRRIGLIALGAYVLPLLIVAAALMGFAWHARHLG